jgi:hypothetical protein
MNVTKHEVAHEMHQHGGNFIHCLALAWYAADDDNRYLIETMWSREWRTHAALALRRKELKHGRKR